MDTPDLKIVGKGDPFVLNVSSSLKASAIKVPLLGSDQHKFPESPVCQADVHLAVTSSQLDFKRDAG